MPRLTCLRSCLVSALGGLLVTQPAFASAIAFEDDAVLGANRWQLTTLLSISPLTSASDAFSVMALAPAPLPVAGQVVQAIAYGLTDTTTVRATMPFNAQQDGSGRLLAGAGDMEIFVKRSMSDADSPLNASLGLQALLPSVDPSDLGMTGGMSVVPSVMLRASTGLGTFLAMGGYQYGLGMVREGQAEPPSEAVLYGLGWNLDVAPRLNLTLDLLGSESLEGMRGGTAEAGPGSRQLSLAPGVTWAVTPEIELLGSVQVPVLRHGSEDEVQPITGMVQVTLNY